MLLILLKNSISRGCVPGPLFPLKVALFCLALFSTPAHQSLAEHCSSDPVQRHVSENQGDAASSAGCWWTLAAGGCCYENLQGIHKDAFVSSFNPVLGAGVLAAKEQCISGHLAEAAVGWPAGEGAALQAQSSTARWLLQKCPLKIILEVSQGQTPLLSLTEILQVAASNIGRSKQHLCFSQATLDVWGLSSWTALRLLLGISSGAERRSFPCRNAADGALGTPAVLSLGTTCQSGCFSNQPVHQT